MNDYTPIMLAIIAGAAASWYCYRWGRADGQADGYEEGRAKGLLEGSGGIVSPSLAGGPGAVPR